MVFALLPLPMSIYICCPVRVPHTVGIFWPVLVVTAKLSRQAPAVEVSVVSVGPRIEKSSKSNLNQQISIVENLKSYMYIHNICKETVN